MNLGKFFHFHRILLGIVINFAAQVWQWIFLKPAASYVIPIKMVNKKKISRVDRYWNYHTVKALKWNSVLASKIYYQWLTNYYYPIGELMEYDINLRNKIVLDYGCGAGNDLFRLTVINKAKKVIGIDLSYKALDIARGRLMVHGINDKRCELLCMTDSTTTLPLANNSIDFVNCTGVLQHVSHPGKILKEFYRILKKGGSGIIMVYNYQSIHLHLYVAYFQMILKRKYKGLSIRDAFSKTTDGEDCPIARCYKSEQFINMCKNAGLTAEYRGGYFSADVLDIYHRYWQKAVNDQNLSSYHKEFLRSLTIDANGYPKYNGYYAGVHGVYKIVKD